MKTYKILYYNICKKNIYIHCNCGQYYGKYKFSFGVWNPKPHGNHYTVTVIPVCSGNNVSTGVWSCPGHPHPTQWNWYFYILLSPHWNLYKGKRRGRVHITPCALLYDQKGHRKLKWTVFLTYGRDGCYNFTELQFVQDSCLAGSVQAN